MHTLKLLLATTKADEKFIAEIFRAVTKAHNMLVEEGKKRLRMLRRDKRYRFAKKHYGMAAEEASGLEKKVRQLQEKLDQCADADRDTEKKLRQQLKECKDRFREAEASRKKYAAELNGCMEEYGVSRNHMEAYATQKLKPRFKGTLHSQQVQVEADRVWSGMEKVLFGSGRDIHYKKYHSIRTVRGKQNCTGIRFDKYALSVLWNGHVIPVACRKKLEEAAGKGTGSRDLSYKLESLSGKVRYCEILREEFLDGYHYYANLYIEGDAPKKTRPGTGRCGVDPGVSTLAAVSEKELFLEELAPRYREYDREICRLQEKADAQRRVLNPQNYADDGTILKRKPGQKRVWNTSPAYEDTMRRIRVLYRKKSAYTRQSHEALCNRLIRSAGTFLVEDMDFRALARRAKETSRQDRSTMITKPDGTTQEIFKYKRKKRFGRSITSRAPALVLQILQRKCGQYGLDFTLTDTRKMKASQYDHTSGACTKHSLKDRELTLSDGTRVQRDLYSAFLHQHADGNLEQPDREACTRDFPSFLDMQDALVRKMKADGVSMKQCFGF